VTSTQELLDVETIEDIELVVNGLDWPTSIAFDEAGHAYVGESGLPFGCSAPGGRILRIDADGERAVVAGGLGHPLTGVVLHDGALWASQGSNPARIDRIDPATGERRVVLDNLPGGGNYHVSEVAFGPDGKMYWAQGSMTNTGLIGPDGLTIGWLRKLPHSIDIPGYDIVLNDVRVTVRDPFSDDPDATVTTGPFSPFGTTVEQGTRLPGRTPATSAVMRVDPDGSAMEMVAWGIRNAFGLRFLPDGRLLAMDQGADDRGSRPIANVPDYLWDVRPGAWYGWPDFMGGVPITDPRFTPEIDTDLPTFILANHDELPEPELPLVEITAHTAATKFDLDPASDGRRLVVGLFGDETPMTAALGSPTVGRALLAIDTADWSQRMLTSEHFHRPIDVRFNQCDGSMWVVDFGRFEMVVSAGRVEVAAESATGAVWRVPSAT
jgi:glucose/arabinose dehydrogenase